MGRFYTGDIEGKFWFAIQSSGDADYFGDVDNFGYYSTTLFWNCCSEECPDGVDLNAICEDCMNDDIDDDCEKDREHYQPTSDEMCESWLTYEFDSEHLEHCKNQLTLLESEIESKIHEDAKAPWIACKTKLHHQTEQSVEFDTIDCMTCDITRIPVDKLHCTHNEFSILIARYELGMKIWNCLHRTGQCHFKAEC
jgi:hypothetical protein